MKIEISVADAYRLAMAARICACDLERQGKHDAAAKYREIDNRLVKRWQRAFREHRKKTAAR